MIRRENLFLTPNDICGGAVLQNNIPCGVIRRPQFAAWNNPNVGWLISLTYSQYHEMKQKGALHLEGVRLLNEEISEGVGPERVQPITKRLQNVTRRSRSRRASLSPLPNEAQCFRFLDRPQHVLIATLHRLVSALYCVCPRSAPKIEVYL